MRAMLHPHSPSLRCCCPAYIHPASDPISCVWQGVEPCLSKSHKLKYSESPRPNLRALLPGPNDGAVKDQATRDAISLILTGRWQPRRTHPVSPKQLDLPFDEPAPDPLQAPPARFHRGGHFDPGRTRSGQPRSAGEVVVILSA